MAHCYTVPEYSESGEGFAAEPPKNWCEGVKKNNHKEHKHARISCVCCRRGGGGGWGGT